MKIKNIFFDFDGVLAESVTAKTEAFREMYLPYGEDIASRVVDYHIRHGGISRFEKFKYWQKTFFDETITDQKTNELALKFSSLVLDKVINSSEVQGAAEFLNNYSEKLQFWIITGTPTEEMEKIAQKRGISHHFIGIHGSPNNKMFWTENLIKKYSLNRNETMFIGDATTDYEAAEFSNLHFALRKHDENHDLFQDYNGIRFTNFDEFTDLIKSYLK